MTEIIKTHPKINKLARYAELAAIIAQLILVLSFAYLFYMLFFDGSGFDEGISELFLEKEKRIALTFWQRGIGLILIILMDLIGLSGLNAARKLFKGYQRGEIFAPVAAKRLIFIGWMVVLLAPASQFATTIGILFFNSLKKPNTNALTFSLDSTDFYAIVFGLLIVVVGHIMYEAVQLSNENKSFV